jgi:hypothetical protein
MGVVVWPMMEFEADDAFGIRCREICAGSTSRNQVLICTPDKDLAQCVRDKRIVQLDRRRNILRDESAVVEKFGVSPRSIPDYLAVVVDSADGYPGISGWEKKPPPRSFHNIRIWRIFRKMAELDFHQACTEACGSIGLVPGMKRCCFVSWLL